MERFELYDGDVVMHYDDDSHKYYIDGEEVPSVTTINDMIPSNLTWWATGVGAEYFKTNGIEALSKSARITIADWLMRRGVVTNDNIVIPTERVREDIAWAVANHGEHFGSGYTFGDMPLFDEISIDETAYGIKSAHNKAKTRAGIIGTAAHKFAERYIEWDINGGSKPRTPTNVLAKNASYAFLRWVEDNDVKFHESEFKIYSRTCNYTGTVDFSATVNGTLCLCDLKTSKGIYMGHLLQIAAYRYAAHEMGMGPFEGAWIIKICKQTGHFKALFIEPERLDMAFEVFSFLRDARPNFKELNRWLMRENRRLKVAA